MKGAARKNMDEKMLLNALHLPTFSSKRHKMALAAIRG